MKILNITLSIVIFLLAAASAVFSYFLFEKRVQFVQSHSAMAAAIRENSSKLDPGSTITDKDLEHHKHAELNQHLVTFGKQVQAVIDQRNSMADSLHHIAGVTGVRKNPSPEEYRSLTNTQANINLVQNQVRSVVTNREDTVDAIVKLSGNYGRDAKVQKNSLKNAVDRNACDDALSPLKKFISSVISKKETYRNVLVQVASASGKRISVSDKNSSSDAKAVLDAVRKKAAEVAGLRRDLRNVQNENRKLTASNRTKDRQLNAAARTLTDTRNALRDLKASIGVAQNFVPWKPGSVDARSRLFGKVTGINRELGYFVIDLGSKSVVYQVSNKKRLPVKLNLDSDVEVMVVRGTEQNSDPKLWLKEDGSVIDSVELAKRDEFVASCRIKKVGDTECVLDIPVGADIKVGDLILYKKAVKN